MTTSPACRTANCSSTASARWRNFAKTMPNLRPTLMVIDLDRFKQVNDSVGIAVGDSILLTLARRLTRILKPQDTLARLAGDQFGLILMSEQDSGAHHRVRRNHPQDHPRADRLQRPRDFPDRLDRPRAQRSADAAVRRDHQGRRACDVSLQAHRRRPHRRLQAGDARAQDRPADAGIRIAPRHRARGNHHPVPADRAAGGSLDRRLRGAGALGSPEARADVAGRNSSPSPRRSA